MDKLIPLINRIQNALGKFENYEGISFPRLVVVGSQSSGKSSVLESIVGKDFLPRGSGIVTRRPLILQLEYSPGNEVGIFDHKPEVQYHDFSEIRAEIIKETERLVGSRHGISNEPIKLKIYSGSVLDITLIDLPGMTKVAIGDQPHDIPASIKKMILSYITDPNAIILAVSAANQDISNSDSLNIAKEVDPYGERTIGIITKIDIMDKGTDALDVVSGKLYHLSLGYVGIICRSQEDINNKKSMAVHLEDEKKFFLNHEKYKNIAHKMGTQYLALSLNNILKKHVLKTLPVLKRKINDMIRTSELELKGYGIPLGENKDFQGIVMLNIITNFSECYRRVIEGRNFSSGASELNGGAHIRYLLFKKFMKKISNIDAFEGLSEQDIRTAIMNSRGLRSNFLVPQEALELLIKVQINKLHEPSLQILQEILENLKNFVKSIDMQEFKVFPNLQGTLFNVADNVLDNCYKPTYDFIIETIENELAYINLDHPQLISIQKALEKTEKDFNDRKMASEIPVQKKWPFSRSENKHVKAPDTGTEKDIKDRIFTEKIVISYFNIIKMNVGDYVVKAIMTFLVGKSMEKLQNELLAQIYCKEKFDEILYESPEMPQRRKAVSEFLLSLKKAASILDEVRDIV
jgi:replication fork clamp-binding protein CrfC